MSIEIVNGFTGPVTLTSAGRTYSLPAGFNGSLTLAGPCTVSGGGQTVQVSIPTYTNVFCSSLQFLNETGDSSARLMVGTNGTAFTAPIDAVYGSSLYVQFGTATGYFWPVGTLPVGAAGVVLTVVGHPEDPPIPFSYSYEGTTFRDSAGTNIVATNTSSTPLGSFVAGVAVRSVEVSTTDIYVTDYQSEATAVTAGFMLAVTIACFRYVMRLVRGLTEQGGDL